MLPSNIEVFVIGKKASTIFIDSARKVSKKTFSDKLIDEDEKNSMVQACKLLKYKFCGVYAADNFPLKLSQNRFIIVNVSSSDSIGTHYTLLCRKNGNYVSADPLGQKLTSYKCLYNRLASAALDIQNVYGLVRNQPIQTQNSILGGVFCIRVAHYIYNETEIVKMSYVDLIRFALHLML